MHQHIFLFSCSKVMDFSSRRNGGIPAVAFIAAINKRAIAGKTMDGKGL
jgi:hypothetical protein